MAYSSNIEPPVRRRRTRPMWFGRPRFLVILVASALAAAVWELVGLWQGLAERGPSLWMGVALDAETAHITAPLRVAVYVVGAWGLWMMKGWARLAGMFYLGAVLAGSMLWWEPGGYGPGYASFAIFWQISMVPLATFCLMYLYRSPERFGGSGDSV